MPPPGTRVTSFKFIVTVYKDAWKWTTFPTLLQVITGVLFVTLYRPLDGTCSGSRKRVTCTR